MIQGPLLPPSLAQAPQPQAVLPLGSGAAPCFGGQWPDRTAHDLRRAELQVFNPSVPPRAQALVCPGGGYLQLQYDREGVQVAQWLAGLGLQAHVLLHRLPGQADGRGQVWPADIALSDGLAALDHLAAQAPELPLLLVGLSSGGHLAGALACQQHRLQPRGLLAAYAPLNANHRAHKAPAGKPDYPPPQKQAFYDAWPIGHPDEPHGQPPVPVFLAYALHDTAVPLDHAINVLRWAHASGADVEAHVFPHAPHGFALRELEGTHDQWPGLAARWIDQLLPER